MSCWVVYSAQGAGIDIQRGFTAYQQGSPPKSKSLSALKESYTPRAQIWGGQRWLLSSCSVCQFFSLICISFHLSRRCLILQTIHRHLICFWFWYEINIPPSHLSLSSRVSFRKLTQMYLPHKKLCCTRRETPNWSNVSIFCILWGLPGQSTVLRLICGDLK